MKASNAGGNAINKRYRQPNITVGSSIDRTSERPHPDQDPVKEPK